MKDDPNVEVYLMDMSLKGGARGMHLDALAVRNHAAFAAFACSTDHRNLEKRPMHTQHWDSRVPHVGFFATRDIEPLEELQYLRQDVAPKKSTRNCNCNGQPCSGFL